MICWSGSVRLNKPWQFERSAGGELLVMSPSSNESEEIAWEIGGQVRAWVRSGIRGMGQASSGGFIRRDGQTSSPDAAWMSVERLRTMTPEQRAQTFKPVCPNFLVEVMSPSDDLARARRKMDAWIASDVELGLLDGAGDGTGLRLPTRPRSGSPRAAR